MIGNFQKNYEKLNEQQKKAVDTIYGPVSVIAGPGTGKTQLLTLRIANILDKVDTTPDMILALTFTEAGVIAMRERLRSFIGSDAYRVTIATFHGFCNDLILQYPEKFQFARDLQMLDDLEKNRLMGKVYLDGKWKHLYNRHDPEIYLGDTLRIVSTLKREGISPADFEKRVLLAISELDNDPELHYQKKYKDKQPGERKPKYYEAQERLYKQQELAHVYEVYEQKLKEKGYYDFDDMIKMVAQKMSDDEQFLAMVQEQYQFVMVDEYQDTNGLQNTIVHKLLEHTEQPNILVVGDDEQSIYRFQGAVMENVLEFHHRYQAAGITTVVLTQNYRSTQTILDASRDVIRHNTDTLEKELNLDKHLISAHPSYQKLTTPIHTYIQEDRNVESLFVVDEIKKLHASGIVLSEIAIIYRKNANPLELMEVMRRSGVPFRKQKGENLLHHPETKKLLHTLQLIDNLADDALLWEVLLYDFWKLDIHYLLHTQNHQKSKRGLRYYESLMDSDDMGIKMVVTRLVEFHALAVNHTLTEFFERFLAASGYRDFVLAQPDKLERLSILNAFFNEIKEFAGKNPNAGIKEFIGYMSDLEKYGLAPLTQPIRTSDQAVNLMTAHGAKGLEFEVVFIYNALSKNWETAREPGGLKLSVALFEDHHLLSRNDQKDIDLQEERRLWYVAMTRAKKHLYITATKNEQMKDDPSLFITEIPENLKESVHYDVDYENVITITTAPIVEHDWSEATRSELKRRASEYVLSVTALNAWLRSPKEFLEKYLIKQPQAKMPAASFGTIMHRGLQVISDAYKDTKKLPPEDLWIDEITRAAGKEILTSKEKEKFVQDATEALRAYLSAPNCPITSFAISEKRFAKSKPVVVEGVPLTGSIDRVEYLSDHEVQVVDFKTGHYKTPGSDYGKDYERQLYFYKLLWDTSGQSRVLTHGVLDYVTDLKDGDIRRTTIAFDTSKLAHLRKQIAAFKESLDALHFPEEPLISGEL